MGKLDDKNILRNTRISEEQAKQFAYEITAEMINSYVNEHQSEYEEWLKKEKKSSNNEE